MQATNAEVIRAFQALRQLGEVKLPPRGALQVRRLARSLEPLAKDVEEVRREILLRHAVLDEKGEVAFNVRTGVQFEPGKALEFRREEAELLDLAVEVTTRLRLEHLGEETIPGGLLADLGPFFEDEEEQI